MTEIECEHAKTESRRVTFSFHLGDNLYLRLCDNCYDRLKATVIQDILSELAARFAMEVKVIKTDSSGG